MKQKTLFDPVWDEVVSAWEMGAIRNLPISPSVATRVIGWLAAQRFGSSLGLSEATVKKYRQVIHNAGVKLKR